MGRCPESLVICNHARLFGVAGLILLFNSNTSVVVIHAGVASTNCLIIVMKGYHYLSHISLLAYACSTTVYTSLSTMCRHHYWAGHPSTPPEQGSRQSKPCPGYQHHLWDPGLARWRGSIHGVVATNIQQDACYRVWGTASRCTQVKGNAHDIMKPSPPSSWIVLVLYLAARLWATTIINILEEES
jgi:hypothetical protein